MTSALAPWWAVVWWDRSGTNEAEPLLLSGYEGLKQREALIGQEHNWIWPTDTLQRVIQLYEATNQPEKAVQWREKLSAEKPPH